jgi:hypothetical protein
MARHRLLRARYGAPFAVMGAIAIGAALPSLSSAAAAPRLPSITVQQLIAKAEASQVGAWKGTVSWTASLGLPDLAGLSGIAGGSGGGDFDWASLVSGTHDLEVWSDGGSARLALIGAASEVDLYSSPGTTWVYDSVTNTATHLETTPGPHAGSISRVAPAATPPAQAAAPSAPATAATPEGLGLDFLRNVAGYTDVSFEPARTIAGQPAYVVSLSPRPGSPGAASSTLGRLTVAVDANNGLILDTSLFAAGSTRPAFEVGFHALDVLAPGQHIAASEFAFSAAPGVKVTTSHRSSPALQLGPSKPGTNGAWLEGSGWGQVVVVPAGAADLGTAERTPRRAVHAPGNPDRRPRITSLGGQLDSVTTAVSGSWGHGRLLSTNLLNVLFLSNGDVDAGFVTAAALEADAASQG